MANKTLLAQIKQRSDTAANWTAKNPIISDGELIIVTTNAGEKRFKVGDGEKTFTQLPYTDERILNNVVTSVNGNTGDVDARSDWNQNDEIAVDYIKNKPLIATNDDAMDFLAEMGMITPVTNSNGEILTSPSNEIYSL